MNITKGHLRIHIFLLYIWSWLSEILTGNYADDFEDVVDSYNSVNNYSDSFEESSTEGGEPSSVSEEDTHGVDEVNEHTYAVF